jgi:hypothetical protein
MIAESSAQSIRFATLQAVVPQETSSTPYSYGVPFPNLRFAIAAHFTPNCGHKCLMLGKSISGLCSAALFRALSRICGMAASLQSQ